MANTITINASKANTVKTIEYLHPNTNSWQDSNILSNVLAGDYTNLMARLKGSNPSILATLGITIHVSDPTNPTVDHFTAPETGWYSSVIRNKTTKRVLKSNMSKVYLSGGHDYPLFFDGKDDERQPISGATTDYEYHIVYHKQDFSLASTYNGPFPNSSTSGGTGPTAWGGVSLLDSWVEIGNKWLAVNGYAERSRGFYHGTTDNVNTVQMVEPVSTMTGTHLAKDLATGIVYRAGDIAFGGQITNPDNSQYNYTGRAITGVNTSDFSAITFGSNGTFVQTDYNKYACIDLKVNGALISGLAVSSKFLIVTHETDNDIAIYDKSTYNLVRTITTINKPRQCAASGTTLILNRDEYIAEFYTINDDGSLTSKGINLSSTISQPGCFAFNKEGTLLAANNVAEQAINFYGDYGEVNSRIPLVGIIYYAKGKTYRYKGAVGVTYNRSDWDNIPINGDSNWTYMIAPLTDTTSHKVFFFNLDGTQNGSPINYDFFFSDTKYFRGWGKSMFLDFRDNGGLVVSNRGNFRVEFFDNQRQPTNQYIEYTSGTYSIAVNANNPTKQYIDYNEYTRNFSIPLGQAGAYAHTANYSRDWRPDLDDVYKRLYCISTWANGRTYALQVNPYQDNQYLIQLVGGRIVPYYDITTNNKGSRLTRNGDIIELTNADTVGNPQMWYKKSVTSYDDNGKPTYGTPTQIAVNNAVKYHDPFVKNVASDPLSDGSIVGYDIDTSPVGSSTGATRSGDDCFHLCVVDNTGQLRWRGMPATNLIYIGEVPEDGYDNGNNTQRGGSWSATAEDIIFVMYIGEFNKGGQTQYIYVYNKYGHYLGRLGDNRDAFFFYSVYQAGQGGNGLTGLAFKIPNTTTLAVSVGNEGGAGPNGINEFVLKDLLNTLTYLPTVPVTQINIFTQPGLDLLAGLPYSSDITSGTGGITFDSTITARTNYQSMQRTSPDISFLFKGAGSAIIPIQSSNQDIPTWTLNGQMAWKDYYGDHPYLRELREILDDTGKVILRIERVNNQETPNLVDNTVSIKLNPTIDNPMTTGIIVGTDTVKDQVRKIFYLRDFSIMKTSDKLLFSYNTYTPTEFTVCEVGANPLRPTSIRSRFVNYGTNAQFTLCWNKLYFITNS